MPESMVSVVVGFSLHAMTKAATERPANTADNLRARRNCGVWVLPWVFMALSWPGGEPFSGGRAQGGVERPACHGSGHAQMAEGPMVASLRLSALTPLP